MTLFIITKQKYELQIYSKYKLENLNLGKVFHIPSFCIMAGLTSGLTEGFSGVVFVYFIFLIGYFNFFWEKAKRHFGLNQLFTNASNAPALIDEDGNFD